MRKKTKTSLACAAALASSLLGAAASAHGQELPEPAKPAAGEETPRALLEKAAFAEEHERDLEKARKLYVRSSLGAQAAKDEKTAEEAAAGLARVLARMGSARAKPAPAGDGPSEAIEDRIYGVVQAACTTEAFPDSVRTDIELVGAAAVPFLERALAGERILRPRDARLVAKGVKSADDAVSFAAKPELAVRALAYIDTPEAATVLERGLRSPDPFVRVAIVRWVRADRHRAVLELAAKDPIEKVRAPAMEKLASVPDPALLPLLEPAARKGNKPALAWLYEHAPAKLVALAADESAASDARMYALEQMANMGNPPRAVTIEAALRAAETTKDPALAGVAFAAIAAHIVPSPAEVKEKRDVLGDEPLRARIETACLAWLDRWPLTTELPRVLFTAGGILTVKAIVTREDLAVVDVARCACVRPEDLGTAAELYRTIPENRPEIARSLLALLGNLVDRGAPAAEIRKGLDGLAGERRSRYLHEVVCRSNGPELVPAYRECLASKEAEVRQAALYRVAGLGDAAFLPDAIARLHDGDEQVRRYAMGALARLAPLDAARAAELLEEAILTAATNREDPLRATAGSAIQTLPPPAAAGLVERLWKKLEDAEVRTSMAHVLLSTPGPEALAALAARYREIPLPNQRAAALQCFERALYEPAIPLLGEALKDPDVDVRTAAVKAFKTFKEHREARAEFDAWQAGQKEARETVAELVKLLESKNAGVVMGAVQALAGLRAKSALPAIVKLIERKDWEGTDGDRQGLQKAITDAIAKIGG